MAKPKASILSAVIKSADYNPLLRDVASLLESARLAAVRSVNSLMTATYWEIGRRIVEFEQGGLDRAGYGDEILTQLSVDLTSRFGRGFSRQNLYLMRAFYTAYPPILQTVSGKSSEPILQTPSGKSPRPILQTVSGKSSEPILQTPSGKSPRPILQTPSGKLPAASAKTPPPVRQELDVDDLKTLTVRFPLPWSHYVRLLSVKDAEPRQFYETEALRGGWSVRQLDRQIASQFYERTLLSRNKRAMLEKAATPREDDKLSPEAEIKDPLVLEFLDLKDEYSEHDLEEALIRKLEDLLLELGGEFAFLGRQKRLRIGGEWYRIDLLFFHRRLRCLVIVDLKVGKFTHADSGQMHLYLSYARKHWTRENENPPVGLILCAQKDAAVAHYALDSLPNEVMAAEYRLVLPKAKTLARELQSTQRALEDRGVTEESKANKPRKRRT
jgi:predicted nuclease of restriction endonuclease-like (RecB) superfamily